MTLNTVQTPSSEDATPSEFVDIMLDMQHKLGSLLSSFEANLIEKFDQTPCGRTKHHTTPETNSIAG